MASSSSPPRLASPAGPPATDALAAALRAERPFDEIVVRGGTVVRGDDEWTVPEIHAGVLVEFGEHLAQVAAGGARTLLLLGDPGTGKTHLLARLRGLVEDRALFLPVDPFPDPRALWAHLLRQTVNGLLRRPAPDRPTVLTSWLGESSLLAEAPGWACGPGGRAERTLPLFLDHVRRRAPEGLFEARSLLAALYHLEVPETEFTAKEWFRGDTLDEEDRRRIGVSRSFEGEHAAQGIFTSLVRLGAGSRPLVLTFDQLDNVPRTDGLPDLQPLLDANSALHHARLPGLLLVFCLVEDTWGRVRSRLGASDLARLDGELLLLPVNTTLGRALLARRLAAAQRRAGLDPGSPPQRLDPLPEAWLAELFAANLRLTPRELLVAAHGWLQEWLADRPTSPAAEASAAAAVEEAAPSKVELLRRRFREALARVSGAPEEPSPAERQDLLRSLAALLRLSFDVSPVRGRSAGLLLSDGAQRVAIVWHEGGSGNEFTSLLKSCQAALHAQPALTLTLLRHEPLGAGWKVGRELHAELFREGGPHRAVDSRALLAPEGPELTAALVAYRALRFAAQEGELTLAGEPLPPAELPELARQAELLPAAALRALLGLPAEAVGAPVPARSPAPPSPSPRAPARSPAPPSPSPRAPARSPAPPSPSPRAPARSPAPPSTSPRAPARSPAPAAARAPARRLPADLPAAAPGSPPPASSRTVGPAVREPLSAVAPPAAGGPPPPVVPLSPGVPVEWIWEALPATLGFALEQRLVSAVRLAHPEAAESEIQQTLQWLLVAGELEPYAADAPAAERVLRRREPA